jgi:hypothetical protein
VQRLELWVSRPVLSYSLTLTLAIGPVRVHEMILHVGSGAIDYLSVTPSESEVIYAPLTYLEPTGNYQIEQVGSTRLVVIEVVPM